jgi:phosphocarrier protein HPr
MAVREFTIKNRLGIHARPAARLAKIANEFESTIRVMKDGLEVNGKSIMGIMMLAAAQGNVIQVEAEGPDEKDAIRALGDLIENKFDEE